MHTGIVDGADTSFTAELLSGVVSHTAEIDEWAVNPGGRNATLQEFGQWS